MKFLGYTVPMLALMPLAAHAQGELTEVSTFLENIVAFMNETLVPLVFAVAFLVFIYGVFKYFILGGSNEDKRKEGQQLMLWGIIGFVIMVSLWGIVNLVANGFGFSGENLENIPSGPTPRG